MVLDLLRFSGDLLLSALDLLRFSGDLLLEVLSAIGENTEN